MFKLFCSNNFQAETIFKDKPDTLSSFSSDEAVNINLSHLK